MLINRRLLQMNKKHANSKIKQKSNYSWKRFRRVYKNNNRCVSLIKISKIYFDVLKLLDFLSTYLM